MRKKIFFLVAMTAVAGANAQNFIINGHKAVDLDLSVLWATCNVGAEKSEDFGGYYYKNAETDIAQWGGAWRMPTKTELEELKNDCYSEWSENYNGAKGYIFFKKKTDENYDVNSDAHIFLPAAGYNNTDNGFGLYWNDLYNATFGFGKEIFPLITTDNNSPFFQSIRLVCDKSAVASLNFVEKENANTVYKTFENGQIVIVRGGVKYNLRGQRL